MPTQVCQKCKQSHPGRVCDYDEKPECAETITVNEVAQPGNERAVAGESIGRARIAGYDPVRIGISPLSYPSLR